MKLIEIHGQDLALLRKLHGIRQSQLAQILGVKQNTVSGWERSKARIKPKHQKAIMDFFLARDLSPELLKGLNYVLYGQMEGGVSDGKKAEEAEKSGNSIYVD